MAATDLPPAPSAGRHVPLLTSTRVLSRAVPLWFRTLPQLLIAVAIVHVPLATLQWLLKNGGGTAKAVTSALGYLEIFTGSELTESFVVHLVFQRLRGAPVELGRSIAIGARRFPTILGIGLLVNLPNFAHVILEDSGPHGSLLTFAFLAVNLVLLLLFCVASPVAVVERLGVLASLRRSRELSRGSRSVVFGVYVIGGLMLALCGLVAGVVLHFLPWGESDLFEFIRDTAVAVVVASFFVVFPIVLYHDLRESKEGIGLDEIAAVFD